MAKPKVAEKKPASAKVAKEALQGSESTAVAVRQLAPMALPAGIKLKRVVTVPSLVMKAAGDMRIVQFLDAIRVSKVENKPDGAGKKRDPANVATVADVQTGEQFIFLVPAVVKANLERDYELNESGQPDYVGRAFLIENLGKRNDSQRYNDFRIAEVEPETE